MGEKAVYATHAHVFQIDPETKRKWLPISSVAVRVAYYHDPGRKTYRIIAIENSKALVNSTITANMSFTKTSPKFGQWSDHRANTVYGLGFASEKDLNLFVEKFSDAKVAARELLEQRKKAQKALENEKPQPPAGSFPSPSLLSPPSIKSPVSPPSMESLESPPSSSGEGKAGEEGKGGGGSPRKQHEPLTNGDSESSLSNGTASASEAKESTTSMSTGSPEAQVETLKYENSKLKVALASSAQNVKRWESEMQTLRNNNTRLTTALEESSQHVSEWKKQLQKYKEESEALKRKVIDLELNRREAVQNSDELVSLQREREELQRENEELKDVLSAVQLDLEAKTAELQGKEEDTRKLVQQVEESSVRSHTLSEENQNLLGQVSELEDQLKMASIASRRRISDVHQSHRQLGEKLKEVLRLHQEMATQFNV